MTLCIFGCVDKEGKPRAAAGEYGMCTVCSNNISGWSRRKRQEQAAYDDQLSLRKARLAEVREPTRHSYVAHLIKLRKRRAATA